jgi:hypothetical protein
MFTSVFTTVFVILKLTKLIRWSWWWVFSPLMVEVFLWIMLILALDVQGKL